MHSSLNYGLAGPCAVLFESKTWNLRGRVTELSVYEWRSRPSEILPLFEGWSCWRQNKSPEVDSLWSLMACTASQTQVALTRLFQGVQTMRQLVYILQTQKELSKTRETFLMYFSTSLLSSFMAGLSANKVILVLVPGKDSEAGIWVQGVFWGCDPRKRRWRADEVRQGRKQNMAWHTSAKMWGNWGMFSPTPICH